MAQAGGGSPRAVRRGSRAGPRRPGPPSSFRHGGQCPAGHRRQADVDPEDERESGQRSGRLGRAPREDDRAEAQREGGRHGMGDARERHRAGHGQPGGEDQGLGRVAAGQGVGEHGHGRVERHANDPPHEQRRAEDEVEPADQEVLARRVVGVEVAVGQLAVGDARAGLEHQTLVVRVDAPPDGDARYQRAEDEQDDVTRPRQGHQTGETPAAGARRTVVSEPGRLQGANPRDERWSRARLVPQQADSGALEHWSNSLDR